MTWGRRIRWLIRLVSITVFVALLVRCIPNIVVAQMSDGQSQCFGSENNGSLSDARRLRGTQYAGRPYCKPCVWWLRTYTHSSVSNATFAAYFDLVGEYGQQEFRETDWVWGESGWPWGGVFYPHDSHQNGLSVDFMVPLKSAVRFPTEFGNWFGYSVEFDENGVMTDDGMGGSFGEIDFHAMAEHLLALQKPAEKVGGGVKRVFFADDLRDELFAAPNGHLVQATIKFAREENQESADEHYHVDFDFPCQEL